MDGELIEYLDRKFQENQRQITEELRGEVRENRRHFEVVTEGLRTEIQQVAEGVVNLDEKLDRELTALRQEMRTEFNEVKAMIRFSYAELERRIEQLEVRYENLAARIQHLEAGRVS